MSKLHVPPSLKLWRINKSKILLVFQFLVVVLSFEILVLRLAKAENMQSDSYRLDWGNFNMTGGKKSSAGYKLMDTVGQTAPGKYTSTGYIVKAGFPYIKTIIAFSFSISDLTIDFGTLIPETPTIPLPTNILTVSNGGAGGYQVKALENHPLQVIGGSTTIPDTTCDLRSCDESAAGTWTSNSIYGFGFNISGHDIPTDFVDSTYYRQFANQNSNETAKVIMSSTHVGTNRQATVTYKAIISGTQAAGNYDNIITFIATPGY